MTNALGVDAANRPSAAARWLGSLALLGWCGAGLVAVVVGGFQPNPYDDVTGTVTPGWPAAFTFVGILSAQALGLAALLRPWSYRRSWGRALLAAVGCAPQAFVFALATMHCPPAQYAHFVWLGLTTLGLGGLFAGSALAALVARSRTRAAPTAGSPRR